MAYLLTPELLRVSNNLILKDFAKNNFIYSEIATDKDQLRADLMRNLHINGRLVAYDDGVVHLHRILYSKAPMKTPQISLPPAQELVGALSVDETVDEDLGSYEIVAPDDSLPPGEILIKNLRAGENSLSDKGFSDIIAKAFPGHCNDKKHSDLIKLYYTQAIIFYAIAPLEGLAVNFHANYHISDSKPNTPPSQKKPYYANLYSDRDSVYFEIEFPHYYVNETASSKSPHPSSHILELHGSKWKFKLVENGFEFIEAQITDKIIFDMFLDKVPLEFKNFPQYSLVARIDDAFNAMYNFKSKSRSNVEAFLGLPDTTNFYDSTFQRIIDNPLGSLRGLIGLPKNILKLFTEFLPLAVEETANFVIDKTTKNINSTSLQVLILLAPMLVISLAFLVRQITSRLTSPVRTFKEAYQFGAKAHPIVGGILATLSAALSITLFTATAFGAAAAFAAAGVPAIAFGATWLASNTAVIGAYASTAASAIVWAASATTLTLSASTAAVIAGSFIAATVFATAIWVRDRVKTLAQWRFTKSTTVDFSTIKEVDSFNVEKSSTAMTVDQLGIAGTLSKRNQSFDHGIHEANQIGQTLTSSIRPGSSSPVPEEDISVDENDTQTKSSSDSIIGEDYTPALSETGANENETNIETMAPSM